MKCPHCLSEFHVEWKSTYLDNDSESNGNIDWYAYHAICPSSKCKKFILFILSGAMVTIPGHQKVGKYPTLIENSIHTFLEIDKEFLAFPRGSIRPRAPKEVPKAFAEDYNEACIILNDSPKASAALSRRCLQSILREKGGFKDKDLFKEIDLAIKSNTLPSYITESIDAIRNIGNLAAHPLKNTLTGEIVPVEPGEAEWTLDVILALFDFYFVQPALIQERKASLNAKLASLGKPPMK